MKKSLYVILASMLLSFSALAQNVENIDSVTGVNYEVDENGEFARIRATGEAELEFGDRRDIRTATQKAQMRAKANIAKFLSERVSSEEVISSLEKSMTNTSGKSKEAIRETIDTYTENIHNSAEALLKGVIATKTDVNKDEKYVQVEVGLSPKTMKAADTLNKGLKEDNSGSLGSSSKETIDSGSGREIKKVKNYDNF
ncbi:hypothetical protein Q7458_07260 [Glaesserella parasuis]|uniref:hypothetical protein n=1 Tax=Glaesserella parasuis TaxID=738 RepID=UPI0013DF60F8|nr:hypothetical protein [Glaesserella parasuis]MDO9799163.1 hypothetical protein [Glaesserella parasuis]MDO9851225.1 hypothetical protein [Glaesserella parasuis]MDO9865283.1 hypothetical protein [Glaesserella parasuis]MDO9882440.1 hypothetical protein [Glaesserella parasuis]MDO9884933.1 hypothetical protein [Glaesserella parasuis]